MASIIFPEGYPSLKSADQKSQLLNNIVDGMAHSRPQALYGKCPKSTTSYEAGFYRVTYEALANAVNGLAWLIDRELGPAQNHETLTYIGPRDLRHTVMLLGAVKAGYKVCSRFLEMMTSFVDWQRADETISSSDASELAPE